MAYFSLQSGYTQRKGDRGLANLGHLSFLFSLAFLRPPTVHAHHKLYMEKNQMAKYCTSFGDRTWG